MATKFHLICRNQIFYFRIKVPTGLRHLIPAVEIKKSLKTCDYDNAQSIAAAMEYKVHAAFYSKRTGMLSDQQINVVVVNQLLSRKSDSEGIILSPAIKA